MYKKGFTFSQFISLERRFKFILGNRNVGIHLVRDYCFIN